MKVKLILALCLLILLPVFLKAQPANMQEFHEAEFKMKSEIWNYQQQLRSGILLDQTDYDVKYWELDIDVTQVSTNTISGKVTMTSEALVDGLTGVDYDLASAMTVDSILMNGQPVSFNHNNSILTVTLDQTYNSGELLTTVVFYGGVPQSSGLGSFSWGTHNGIIIVTTLSEPEGARDWWPCKDIPHDKCDSADIKITVADSLVATSNGKLISNVNNGNGTRTFHWHSSYPITTYLISLAITNYQSFTDWYVTVGGDSMPIVNYVYPEHFNQAVEDLNITSAAIGVFAGLFGEYPFINEKYGHSIFPWGGAMEHQCNTSYGQWLIRGDHRYDMIVVHELAHMWFGDMITCDIWPEIWMNEGFATYCEALYAEHYYGFSAYRDYMTNVNSVTYPSGPIYDPDVLFSGNTVYHKGSWVLHMLRGVMGDDAFFDGMYAYANHPDYKYGTITTHQFRAIMEQFYGADLNWYFDEWIWGRNRPFYTYSWMDEDIGNNQHEVFLHIDQDQPAPSYEVFTMPVKVYTRINGVDTVITVYNDSREDDFRFVVNGDPTGLVIDKYDWILKFVSVESYQMNIVTTELPNGNINTYYDEIIEARGGQTPYTFSLENGSLPSGINLNNTTGSITGTPGIEGEYTFTVRCTDSSNPVITDDQEYVINIEDATGITDEIISVPSNFALIGNYPNPFNSSTVISFRLADQGYVNLEIYNILGQNITTLHDGFLNSGQHDFIWNAGSLPSGVYLYRLTAGANSDTKKMLLIK